MGQEHSVQAPRRIPNKLSKPKSTSTANLLSRSALRLDQKEPVHQDVPGHENRYSVIFADPEVRRDVVIKDEQEIENKRSSILRSYSTPDQHHLGLREDILSTPVHVEHPIYPWRDQPRQNSVTEGFPLEPQPDARPLNRSRMSLQHVPNLQSQQRLSLIAELPTPSSELNRRLSTTYGELRSPQLPDPKYTQANLEAEIYGPTRRSSLLQHGVATRPSLVNDSRQSLPSQTGTLNPPPDYYKGPSLPHAYLNSLKQQDLPRVETPDELSYRHTGAFKLGSLRITNGVASPTPSIERAVTMSGGEDYISAGNIRRIVEGHRRGASSRSNTLSIAGDHLKSPWIVREESPLRHAKRFDPPAKIDTKLPEIDTTLANFDFDSTFAGLEEVVSPTRSQELADDYIQDIAMSPYSFVPSRTPSPRLEPTSKHTAMEDELFDAEPLTPSLSHVPSTADSGYEAPSRESSTTVQKPLAKADSGYSSNMSLRSFKKHDQEAPPVPAKDFPSSSRDPVLRVASSTYSFSSNPEESIDRSGSDGSLRKAYPRVNEPSVRSQSNSNGGNNNIPPPTSGTTKEDRVAKSYTETQDQPPKQGLISQPQSRPKLLQKHSRSGSDSKATISKIVSNKKEKSRPYSIQPQSTPVPIFTIHNSHEDINAPPVPLDTARQLSDRVNSFPMGSFANTFRALRRSGSKETLGTIFSVGSGYTEVPRVQELTQDRLQEPLPSPPTPSPVVPEMSSRRNSVTTSNSYCPPKTPPRKLQKRASFTQDMAAFEELDLTKSSTYQSFQDSRVTLVEKLKTKRSQSMNSQTEQEKAKEIVRPRNVSSESRTSTITASTMLTTKHSYDSISRQNPFLSRSSSMERTESVPVHNPAEKFLDVEPEPVERRLSWGNREKKQPPISMQTQRKVTPIPTATYKLFPTPPKRPPPVPIVPYSKDEPKMTPAPPTPTRPERAPPPPPQKPLPPSPLSVQKFSPLPSPISIPPPHIAKLQVHKDSPRPHVEVSGQVKDPWAEQKSYWSERRKSANDSVKSQNSERPAAPNRKSTNDSIINPPRPSLPDRNSSSTVNTIRSGGRRPPSVHQNANLKIQKSMEAVRARMFMEQRMSMQSLPNLRQASGEYKNDEEDDNSKTGGIEELRARRAKEEKARQRRERDMAGERLAGWERTQDGSTPGEYHHTYGLDINVATPYDYSHRNNRPPSPEQEYFSQPTTYSNGDYKHYRDIHRQHNSTEDMLVLDRFSGGLDYGYEPGRGLTGSAGMRDNGMMKGGGRKSVHTSQDYGLDFSDVPVFLQRIPGVEGLQEIRYK